MPTLPSSQNLLNSIKQYPTPSTTPIQPTNPQSLSGWMQLYYLLKGKALSPETQKAKRNDLTKFLLFYRQYTKSDDIHRWIAPITKAFQDHLLLQSSTTTQKPYKTTTINRTMKTVKHFAKWLTTRQTLCDGDPAKAISYLIEDEPDWNGLTNQEIDALEKACQDRLNDTKNARQKP